MLLSQVTDLIAKRYPSILTASQFFLILLSCTNSILAWYHTVSHISDGKTVLNRWMIEKQGCVNVRIAILTTKRMYFGVQKSWHMRFFTNDVDECFSHHGINQVRWMTAGNYFSSCGNSLLSPPWGIYNETQKHILSYQKLGPSAFCAGEGGQEAGLPALTHAARKSQVVHAAEAALPWHDLSGYLGNTYLPAPQHHRCLWITPSFWLYQHTAMQMRRLRSPTHIQLSQVAYREQQPQWWMDSLRHKNYLCLTAWLRA